MKSGDSLGGITGLAYSSTHSYNPLQQKDILKISKGKKMQGTKSRLNQVQASKHLLSVESHKTFLATCEMLSTSAVH